MKYAVIVTALLASVLITPTVAFAGDWGRFLGGMAKGASDVAKRHAETQDAAELIRLKAEMDMEREARIAEDQRQRNIAENQRQRSREAQLLAERAQLIAERELSDIHPGWINLTSTPEYKAWRATLPEDTRETSPTQDIAASVQDAAKLIEAFKKHQSDKSNHRN